MRSANLYVRLSTVLLVGMAADLAQAAPPSPGRTNAATGSRPTAGVPHQNATVPAATHTATAAPLQLVANFSHQVTGVTVAKDGRIFVNFPRWTEDTAVSVAELKNGRLVPFPDAEWNSWRNAKQDEISAKDHWVCIQAVVADPQGNIWVLDPAAPAMAAVVKNGPKLVEIDLKTNKPGRVIAFGEDVAPQGSYLNDVRFSPDAKTAYMTDSGAKGALIVVDLASGKARRVLDGDPSTQADKSVTVKWDGKPLRRPDGRGVDFSADGIALSSDGKTLYWQAIKGKTLYSIATDALGDALKGAAGKDAVDKDLAGKIKVVGENGPADGLFISRHDGLMYVTSPQDNAVKTRDLTKSDAPRMIVQDPRLHWPDTISEAADGTIYFTTSHIQDSAMYKPGAPTALPTQLWKISSTGPGANAKKQ